MESLTLDQQVQLFLRINGSGSGYGDGYGDGDGDGDGDGYGYGYGTGTGSGDGDGYGSGYGYGTGTGSGDGDGYGDGDGDGDGTGIKSINGERVYLVDGVQTIFRVVHAHRNCAIGAIVNGDLSLTLCYIARVGDYFAHGSSLREAFQYAQKKALDNMPVEEKIERFKDAHPELDTPYDDLFEWHHTLTGSCEAGRLAWCNNHELEPTDAITVRSFIELTRDNYGGEIIRQLAKSYGL